MKLKNYLVAAALLCPVICLAEAVNQEQSIPFYKVKIKSGNKISARYDFDPNHQTLVCTSTAFSLATGVVSWKYKDALYSALLYPTNHLSLKDNAYPEGFFADPEGKLTIDNSSPRAGDMIVSCEYRTWA